MMPADAARPAPGLQVSRWFNAPATLRLADLRGQVVAIEAFQMLCPGCVFHGLPQAQRIRATFPNHDVSVIGLHTVFEHHAAMEPVALEAFLHEYRIAFPVGVDEPSDGDPLPRTMRAWGQRGTPTLWLLDRAGRVRAEHLGEVSDMAVGAQIAALVAEPASGSADQDALSTVSADGDVCRPKTDRKEDAG